MSKVAVIQAASIPFDSASSVDKAATILQRVAANGATLAVFPEAFLGATPKASALAA